MRVLLIFAALATVAFGFATDHQNNNNNGVPQLLDRRIIGGNAVNISHHPHQIGLRYKSLYYPDDPYSHRCGGSIYTEDIVITAAHCVVAKVPSEFLVVAGTSNSRGSDGAVVRVRDIIAHENYDSLLYDNDIAILFLATPVPINNITIKTIGLVEKEIRENTKATVSGWGSMVSGGSISDILQDVRVPIVSHENCNEDYDGLITDGMLCAGVRGQGGKDACQGDSGGPLIVDNKLAGIVSWGYGCARAEYPGVYTKVSYYISWIKEKIEEYKK